MISESMAEAVRTVEIAELIARLEERLGITSEEET